MAAEQPKAYAFNDILFSFGGKDASGFAPDDGITVTEDQDEIAAEVGLDGSVAVSRIEGGNLFMVEMTLWKSSDYNDFLTDCAERNRRGPGLVFRALSIRDLNGRGLHSAPYGIVKKRPESTYAQKMGKLKWSFFGINGQNLPKGSKVVTST